jgi:hypothetical protein
MNHFFDKIRNYESLLVLSVAVALDSSEDDEEN